MKIKNRAFDEVRKPGFVTMRQIRKGREKGERQIEDFNLPVESWPF
mgnify:CR=1 FL=1|jgi:hypothetical protein